MMCGSTTGKPIEQNPSHKAPISKDGKPHTYSVQSELIIAMDESDFTWVVFFSKPVSVECYSDAMPVLSLSSQWHAFVHVVSLHLMIIKSI